MFLFRVLTILYVYLFSLSLRAENDMEIHEVYTVIILVLGYIIQFYRFTIGYVLFPQIIEDIYTRLFFNWCDVSVILAEVLGSQLDAVC